MNNEQSSFKRLLDEIKNTNIKAEEIPTSDLLLYTYVFYDFFVRLSPEETLQYVGDSELDTFVAKQIAICAELDLRIPRRK